MYLKRYAIVQINVNRPAPFSKEFPGPLNPPSPHPYGVFQLPLWWGYFLERHIINILHILNITPKKVSILKNPFQYN